MPRDNQYEVDVVLSDGTPYPFRGRINFADPSFSQDTGSFMVRAVLPNPNLELRPGMFLTAYIRGPVRPNAIVVPQLAVQQGPNGHLVYVVKQDGVAEIRPVVVGDYFGEHDIVIVTGLAAGDRVVVDGVLKVVPGQPVKAAEVKRAAPAAAPGAPAAAAGSAPGASAPGAVPVPPTGTPRGSGKAEKRPVASTLLAPEGPGAAPSAGAAPTAGAGSSAGAGSRAYGPDAFSPDENWLKRGARLTIPDRATLAAIDATAAREEVRIAREKWLAARGGAR
jgi:hypothetical protein